jgi:hypothetical protein
MESVETQIPHFGRCQMTFEIPFENWAEFLNDFSKRRFGWEAKIEIVSERLGDQVLAAGIPLVGVAFENRGGRSEIELLIGEGNRHQTHTVVEPMALFYMNEESGYRGMLGIEEEDGTKTLVFLVNPMPIRIGYEASRIVATS